MTIINGYKKPWSLLRHFGIHAYKWHDCEGCNNKMFARPGIKYEGGNGHGFHSIFIVYWPRRYVVISWDDTKCGDCCCG